jgi:glycosyltransferase involved in cell wall biosynthesis
MSAFFAHRLYLATGLLSCGHEVWLCAGALPTTLPKDLPKNLKLIELKLVQQHFSLASDIQLMWKFQTLLKTIQPDIVHAFTIKPILYMSMCQAINRLLLRNVPKLVLTFPGLGKVFERAQGLLGYVRLRLVSSFLKYSLKLLPYTATFENSYDQDILVCTGIIRMENSRTILGAGIDYSKYYPPQGTRSSGPITFLFASRLLAAKGVKVFLEAVVAAEMPPAKAHFVIAGQYDSANPDAIDVANLIASDTKYANVEFVGEVEANLMPDLLKSADVVCLPTQLSEGFPRILIEAAACGCALIGSDQPSIRQIIIEGETGWLLSSNKVEELASKMSYAANNLDNTRVAGKNAANYVKKLPFDNEAVYEKFNDIYAELLQR